MSFMEFSLDNQIMFEAIASTQYWLKITQSPTGAWAVKSVILVKGNGTAYEDNQTELLRRLQRYANIPHGM